jgi:hypothetical protein
MLSKISHAQKDKRSTIYFYKAHREVEHCFFFGGGAGGWGKWRLTFNGARVAARKDGKSSGDGRW